MTLTYRGAYFVDRFERDTRIDFFKTALLLARSGSRAYNTHTDASDWDFNGVIAPPAKHVLGLDVFDGWEPKKGALDHEVDGKIHGIGKTIRLLLKGNPNMLEVLWYPTEVFEYVSPMGDTLRGHRDLFSSKRAYDSLAKYADAQFNVMMRGTEMDRQEWDAALSLIEAAGWRVKQIVKGAPRDMPDYPAVTVALGTLPGQVGTTEDPYVLNNVLTRAVGTIKTLHSRQFRSGLGEARRNSILQFGYDPKNASHLIRLLYLGRDFARHGELFPFMVGAARNNVIDIKTGQWELDKVKDLAQSLWEQCQHAFRTTSLPDEPDREAAEDLLIHIQRLAVT